MFLLRSGTVQDKAPGASRIFRRERTSPPETLPALDGPVPFYDKGENVPKEQRNDQTQDIKIACHGADRLPLDAIEDFQGKLKNRSRKDIDKIIVSIEKYGFSFPFFVWQSQGRNLCLDGHGRIQALHEMRRRGTSLPLFPVAYIDAQDEAEAKQKLLRLNSQYGEMTVESVLEFMEGLEIEPDELALPTGGTLKFTGPNQDTTGDDDIPAIQEIPFTRPGDVYTLTTGRGTHRLICGDSTNRETVSRLIEGRLIDLWLTDPPHNVDYAGKNEMLNRADKGNRVQEAIENDKMGDAAFREFLTKAFTAAAEHLKPGGVFYILHAPTETVNFWGSITATGLDVRQVMVWVKNNFVIGRADYQWKHEGILYGWKAGAPHFWDGGRSQTTVREDSLEKPIDEMKKEELLELVKALKAERRAIPTTVIECDKPSRSAEHPTMKPVRLLAGFILNSSKKKGLIFDGFGGSGSTMIAAEQTGRTCYMAELDPHYCDVIVRRFHIWATENGMEPEILHNGEPIKGGLIDEVENGRGGKKLKQFGASPSTPQEVAIA
jgi:DNA modification methylase